MGARGAGRGVVADGLRAPRPAVRGREIFTRGVGGKSAPGADQACERFSAFIAGIVRDILGGRAFVISGGGGLSVVASGVSGPGAPPLFVS